MPMHNLFGAHRVGLVATAALAITMGAAGPAAAAQYGNSYAGHNDGTRSASASVANDTLTITGTNGADQIAVSLAADPNTLNVDFGADGTIDQSFDRTTFSAIAVFLGNGNDEFRVQGTSPDEAITVDGGAGDDIIATGSANDLILGGSGNDTINGGAGDDVIIGGSGNDTVVGAPGHDTAFLGSGQDTFVWNPGDGSDVVDGGTGTDAMVFNGASANEVMSLSANGQRSVFLRNVGNIRMDLDRIEQVDVNALKGTDSVTINDMSGTSVRDVNVDLSDGTGAGDGQSDVVTVNGTDHADHVQVDADGTTTDVVGLRTRTHITGSESTLDQLQVNTLGGNDRVNVDPNTSALIGVGVDLGTDQH